MKNDETKKIVEALTSCSVGGACRTCSYNDRMADNELCCGILSKDAASIIEHQIAEIDTLKTRIADMSKAMMYNARHSTRHGKWIRDYEDHGIEYCRCSECNHGDEHTHGVTVPYCWFCGAKMEM